MIDKLQLARAKKEQRIESGSDPVIAGWQCFLEEMLIQLEAFMIPGNMVTFQNVTGDEKKQFELLQHNVRLPEQVCAVFIPPSVLQSMLHGGKEQISSLPPNLPDSGIVLACRCGTYDLIINTLFANQPFSPGIDVYEHGNLLAGYSFTTLDECRNELTAVIHTYLDRSIAIDVS
jgi:hypothetical protein